LTVDVFFDKPAAGTSVAIAVQGSKDNSTWADVGKAAFTLAEMQAGVCKVAISPNEYQYLRVNVTATGTFTGSAKAYLNTYAGK
jgi:hypothetical protein